MFDDHDDTAELAKPVTGEELVRFVFFAMLETFAQLAPDSKTGDLMLEGVANHLLDSSAKSSDPRLSVLLRALAKKLIETEEGACG